MSDPADAATADPVLNEHGMTELRLAAYHGDAGWVRRCLTLGRMDVHARSRNGFTPLFWNASMGIVDGDREEVTVILLEAGADPEARDPTGYTVLMAASGSGNHDMVRLLVEAGADPRARDARGETAADHGYLSPKVLWALRRRWKRRRRPASGYVRP